MADLPARIKVGPHVYTVVADVARLREFEHVGGNGQPQHGYTDRFLCEIMVDPTEARCQQRDTLWHEVKHAVAGLIAYGDELPEEAAVARMAPWELLVLRENPALVAFLVEPNDA